MNTYYLRCRQSRYATLIARGIRMGAIVQLDGQISAAGNGCWDYIGVKYPAMEEGEPLPEPVGGAADPWIHVNFRTEHDLRVLATAAAQAGDTDIAQGLEEIASYFITDADGNACAPAFPLRVFL